MKKKSGSKSGHLFSSVFQLRTWSDWDRIKTANRYLGRGIKKLTVPQKSRVTESFEAAKQRLNLTDKDLLVRQKALLRVAIIMVVFAVFLLTYAIYRFYYHNNKSGVLSLIVMLIALVFAFRYHFWYFQIKEHKLGCSINEWFREGLLGDKR